MKNHYEIMTELVDLKPTQKLLDIGSGKGDFAILAKQTFPQSEINGIDPSKGNVELSQDKAKRLGVLVNYSVGIGEKLPFDNNHFDVITCLRTFHHMSRPKRLDTLNEINRTLKPDGLFILGDKFRPANLSGRLALICYTLYEGKDYFNYVMDTFERKIPQDLKNVGLRIIDDSKFSGSNQFLVCKKQ